MSAESVLYAALSGHAGLGALVDTRIYPDVLPEEAAYPAVVFARVATDPTYNLAGALLCEDVELQIGAWSTTRGEADAVAAQVVAALAASGQRHVAQESGYDEDVGLYAATVSVELLINA